MQIAEDEEFTAISRLDVLGKQSSAAFRINDNIGVYLKYNSVKPKPNGEFPFTFRQEHLKELEDMQGKLKKVFVALVRHDAREVCVAALPKLKEMIAARKAAAGDAEDQHVVLVTASKNSKLHAYLNVPGKKGKLFKATAIKVARNDFPGMLFA